MKKENPDMVHAYNDGAKTGIESERIRILKLIEEMKFNHDCEIIIPAYLIDADGLKSKIEEKI